MYLRLTCPGCLAQLSPHAPSGPELSERHVYFPCHTPKTPLPNACAKRSCCIWTGPRVVCTAAPCCATCLVAEAAWRPMCCAVQVTSRAAVVQRRAALPWLECIRKPSHPGHHSYCSQGKGQGQYLIFFDRAIAELRVGVDAEGD